MRHVPSFRNDASARPPYRLYAVLCAVLGIVPLIILAVLADTATENRDRRHQYQDRAVATTATVERFVETSRQVGRETVTRYPMLVRYEQDGRRVSAAVRNLREVPPAEQARWIGREVKIRYLPGQADSVIQESDLDLLPRASDMIEWMLMPLLMLGVCVYLTASLWRKGRSGTPA